MDVGPGAKMDVGLVLGKDVGPGPEQRQKEEENSFLGGFPIVQLGAIAPPSGQGTTPNWASARMGEILSRATA